MQHCPPEKLVFYRTANVVNCRFLCKMWIKSCEKWPFLCFLEWFFQTFAVRANASTSHMVMWTVRLPWRHEQQWPTSSSSVSLSAPSVVWKTRRERKLNVLFHQHPKIHPELVVVQFQLLYKEMKLPLWPYFLFFFFFKGMMRTEMRDESIFHVFRVSCLFFFVYWSLGLKSVENASWS